MFKPAGHQNLNALVLVLASSLWNIEMSWLGSLSCVLISVDVGQDLWFRESWDIFEMEQDVAKVFL